MSNTSEQKQEQMYAKAMDYFALVHNANEVLDRKAIAAVQVAAILLGLIAAFAEPIDFCVLSGWLRALAIALFVATAFVSLFAWRPRDLKGYPNPAETWAWGMQESVDLDALRKLWQESAQEMCAHVQAVNDVKGRCFKAAFWLLVVGLSALVVSHFMFSGGI